MSHITVNHKDKGLTKTEICHIYFAWKFLKFGVVFQNVSFQIISTDQNIFKVGNSHLNSLNLCYFGVFIKIPGQIFMYSI